MAKKRPRYVNPPVNIHGNLIIDDLNSLLEALGALDDRGLVLALAAFAEETLGMLLLAYMRNPKQARELVEGFNAPLGSFSTRIKAAYALGLLHREQHDDLDHLRKIRNAFAHDWQGVSFDKEEIVSIVRSMHAKVMHNRRAEGDERNQLREAMSTILIELRMMLKHIKKHTTRIPDLAYRMSHQPPVVVELELVNELSPHS